MPPEAQNDAFWRTLLAKNDRWLRASLYARLRDPDAVDEVMQNVAVAVLRNRDQLKDLEKAGPWIYRIAIRQTLLYRRSCGRDRALTQRYIERQGTEPSHAGDAADWLLMMERNSMIRRALNELPARDAEVLMLKYGEGLSYQAIADRLGVSVSSVESRLHRSRRRLRGRLSAMGVVETANS